MIECHLKGFRDTYKPRSRVGLGKGSHSTSQRLVEALAEPCAKTKRTYGLCTGKGTAHVQGVAGRQRLQLAERRGTLAPRPLRWRGGDVAQFFLSFS
jgi:ribose 5-phosphate isomerase